MSVSGALRRSVSTCTTNGLNKNQLKSLPLFDFFATQKPKVSYTLGHGAAGFAKRRGSNSKPAQSSHVQVGEDAYFRRSDAIGVADGIGGWANTAGANSALYSSRLMHYANQEMDRFEDTEDTYFFKYDQADPLDILKNSYEQSLKEAQRSNILGSTTACIAILRHDELRVANIGDCGISIIRNQNYIFQSEEQQHAFNFPYQLGLRSRDQPSDAQSFTVKIEKGDIVIMATDGLYDNLFDKDILRLTQDHVLTNTMPASRDRPARVRNLQPQILADVLANAAKEISETKYRIDTPFQRRAVKEGLLMEGGKPDDISVIVAVVKDCEDSPDRRL
ncbi:hypothetical protein G6F56_003997 [Rhizopus delemar]|uniref:Protein phosphatase n=1 Tax=Rhizopus stolonifer TaxID=4846 RepID=A0A367JKD3_RHIST|nr:hypothetical protein G6F56_003997 [Rhizopus delemar]RCH90376.1 hypothetical protein CU098_003375 [Rhizopus stolonifer]